MRGGGRSAGGAAATPTVPAGGAFFKLLRGGEVVAPEPQGVCDVLVAGGKVAAVAAPGEIRLAGVAVEEIGVAGLWVVPGLVDPHVHLLGGGGEGGPATRAPEIRVEDIVSCGVTTVIGCLGTDGVTRHMASLLAKARGLEAEGIAAFILSGSYQVPVTTVTGSVRGDLVLLDKVVGAGEIAISDHRSAQPTFEELARLAAECRVGGMLGGKAGILHLHVGDGPRGLEFLRRLAAETEIPITQVVPTHCNRNSRLLDEAVAHVAAGGCADLTAGLESHGAGLSVADAVRRLRAAGAPLQRVTVSSDANGSIPLFDEAGSLVGLGVASEQVLLPAFREVVAAGLVDLPTAVALFATNAARIYKLPGKGCVAPGSDADILVLDRELQLRHVLAGGRWAVRDGRTVLRGTFTRGGLARD